MAAPALFLGIGESSCSYVVTFCPRRASQGPFHSSRKTNRMTRTAVHTTPDVSVSVQKSNMRDSLIVTLTLCALSLTVRPVHACSHRKGRALV